MTHNRKSPHGSFHFPVTCHQDEPRISCSFVLIRLIRFTPVFRVFSFLSPQPCLYYLPHTPPQSPILTFMSFAMFWFSTHWVFTRTISWPSSSDWDMVHHFIFNWGQWLSVTQKPSLANNLAGSERTPRISSWSMIGCWQTQDYAGLVSLLYQWAHLAW